MSGTSNIHANRIHLKIIYFCGWYQSILNYSVTPKPSYGHKYCRKVEMISLLVINRINKQAVVCEMLLISLKSNIYYPYLLM